MQYRRAKIPGGTYFFTIVTFRRRKFLCEPDNVELLRTAFRTVKSAMLGIPLNAKRYAQIL